MTSGVLPMHFLPRRLMNAIREVFESIPEVEKAIHYSTLTYEDFSFSTHYEFLIFGRVHESAFLARFDQKFALFDPVGDFEFVFEHDMSDKAEVRHIERTGILIYLKKTQ